LSRSTLSPETMSHSMFLSCARVAHAPGAHINPGAAAAASAAVQRAGCWAHWANQCAICHSHANVQALPLPVTHTRSPRACF
jgi:hypothetical protein